MTWLLLAGKFFFFFNWVSREEGRVLVWLLQLFSQRWLNAKMCVSVHVRACLHVWICPLINVVLFYCFQ